MNDDYKTHLDNLDRCYPPPRSAISLDELCEVLPTVKKKTLQNHVSLGKLPFPIMKVGGKVCIAKTVVAAFLAGLPTPKEGEEGKDVVNPGLKPIGRPRTSLGFERFAALSLLKILDAYFKAERDDLEDVLAGKTFPDLPHNTI